MSVVMPVMRESQRAGWHALFDVYDSHPSGWTLVGGQMVHLWCAERGRSPMRPTDDLDAVLDVRGEPSDPGILMTFTTVLDRLGFVPAGTSPTGHQHRWVKGDAQIDVLIPRHVGERAAQRRGARGGTTLETPGAQQALDRSENLRVTVGERHGTVRRPSLLGALVAKAAAHTVTLDTARARHLDDFLVLTTLIEPADRVDAATRRDRDHLHGMLGAIAKSRRSLLSVDGAQDGVYALRLALGLEV
ncbi:hypothetical protein CTKZ_25230 [Cellulomonas algicola]|uniref:Uncharacterized protein n=2 Tax=Cellulomonas algicola TaxID=2071633 RepID=A0A401V241_9CELL|nr:hypothetical protein CTKZ_25230 [Cellulomonas algicola]